MTDYTKLDEIYNEINVLMFREFLEKMNASEGSTKKEMTKT